MVIMYHHLWYIICAVWHALPLVAALLIAKQMLGGSFNGTPCLPYYIFYTFLFVSLVSVFRCVLPYKYHAVLRMLFKLMKLCVITGSRCVRRLRHALLWP